MIIDVDTDRTRNLHGHRRRHWTPNMDLQYRHSACTTATKFRTVNFPELMSMHVLVLLPCVEIFPGMTEYSADFTQGILYVELSGFP
jgi:hypothetical protein